MDNSEAMETVDQNVPQSNRPPQPSMLPRLANRSGSNVDRSLRRVIKFVKDAQAASSVSKANPFASKGRKMSVDRKKGSNKKAPPSTTRAQTESPSTSATETAALSHGIEQIDLTDDLIDQPEATAPTDGTLSAEEMAIVRGCVATLRPEKLEMFAEFKRLHPTMCIICWVIHSAMRWNHKEAECFNRWRVCLRPAPSTTRLAPTTNRVANDLQQPNGYHNVPPPATFTPRSGTPRGRFAKRAGLGGSRGGFRGGRNGSGWHRGTDPWECPGGQRYGQGIRKSVHVVYYK